MCDFHGRLRDPPSLVPLYCFGRCELRCADEGSVPRAPKSGIEDPKIRVVQNIRRFQDRRNRVFPGVQAMPWRANDSAPPASALGREMHQIQSKPMFAETVRNAAPITSAQMRGYLSSVLCWFDYTPILRNSAPLKPTRTGWFCRYDGHETRRPVVDT